MENKISIAIVDDQALFREALRTLLETNRDFFVCGEAGNGEEAISLAVIKKPDVILMDLRMPVMDGVAAIKKIRTLNPNIKIIVLTTFDDDELVYEGLKAGAIGYLLKDVSTSQLWDAVRRALNGEYILHPAITAKVVTGFTRMPISDRMAAINTLVDPLSERELEVLQWVATGANNKEIALALFITEGTVKNHMRSILSKLDARDRMQAVIRARELSILKT